MGVVVGVFLILLIAILGVILLVASVLMGVTFLVSLLLTLLLLPLKIFFWIVRAILRI
ncbi:hypothetical protein KAW53_06940 [Candidatus Bathyarchaeota archaeon]|jgi:hypothetical protein|nr:hypothetical protein [Candidatus Bathyarchaeota archaeon]MCK4438892.1 hypothetical protein [Candidatus Bathyarchaeota archaeon]